MNELTVYASVSRQWKMVMLVAKEGNNLFAMCLKYKGTAFVPFECVNFGKLQVLEKKKKNKASTKGYTSACRSITCRRNPIFALSRRDCLMLMVRFFTVCSSSLYAEVSTNAEHSGKNSYSRVSQHSELNVNFCFFSNKMQFTFCMV